MIAPTGTGDGRSLALRLDEAVSLPDSAGGPKHLVERGEEIELRLIGAAPAAAFGGFRGHALAGAVDHAGRLAAFAFASDIAGEHGGEVKLREARVRDSLNAALLRDGLAHPEFDPSIPDPYRATLAAAAAEARAAGAGLWASDPGRADSWPKLRRLVALFHAGGGREPTAFPGWLRQQGLDEPVLLASGDLAWLSTLVEADGERLRLRVPPEEIMGLPEEAP